MNVDHASISAIATKQHGLVTLDQLTLCGMSERAVQRRAASGAYVRVRRRVYAIGHLPACQETRWSAAVLAAGPGSCLSHLAAARLWKVLVWAPSRIDVTTPTSRRPMTGVARHVTRLGPGEADVVRGIPVTSPSRTIADCAQLLDVDQVVRLMREARHLGLFDRVALERFCDPRPRRAGAPTLRAALARHGAGHAGFRSRFERDVRDVLVARGAPEPKINAPVPTDDGIVEVDQSWPECMVCLEVDGPTHDDDEQTRVDVRRRAALRRAGWDLHVLHWAAFGASPHDATDEVLAALARIDLTLPTRFVGNAAIVERQHPVAHFA